MNIMNTATVRFITPGDLQDCPVRVLNVHVGSSRCGQVIANDSVLRSSTVDATSAEALPELGIAQLSSSGLKTSRKHAGSARRRPLTCTRAARRPPYTRRNADGAADVVLEDASPCTNQCFRCDKKVAKKASKWTPAEQVSRLLPFEQIRL